MPDASYYLQGQQGGEVLSGSMSSTGPFRFMVVVNDAVLDTFESNLENGDGGLVSITLPAGLVIGGIITSVAVTSGVVICYHGRE